MMTRTQYDPIPANGSEFELSVVQVSDEQRIRFRPQHLGTIPQWITLEPRTFAWMDCFCDEYYEGIWSSYTLSNGGALTAPGADSGNKRHLLNGMSGSGMEMNVEAVGIAVYLIEYSYYARPIGCDVVTGHYYRLRDYALQHPESSAVVRIID